MSWFSDIVSGVGRAVTGVGDIVDPITDAFGEFDWGDIGDAVAGVDWDFFADNAIYAGEMAATLAAAIATGGVAGIAFAGLDVLGISDEVMGQLAQSMPQDQYQVLVQERNRQMSQAQGGGGLNTLAYVGLGLGVLALMMSSRK